MMHWFVVLICVLYIYIYLSVCGCIYIYKYIDNYQIIYISYDFDMSWYIHATCSWNLVNRLRSIINFKPLTTWMGWWRMHLVPEDLLRCGLEKRTNRDSGCRLCWCLAATCLLSAIVPARFGDLHSTVAHCFEDALKCCWSRAALVEDQQNKNNQKQCAAHWVFLEWCQTFHQAHKVNFRTEGFKAHSALHWILLDSCRSISSTRARSAARDLTSEGSKNTI
jgi:hypothetical protein